MGVVGAVGAHHREAEANGRIQPKGRSQKRASKLCSNLVDRRVKKPSRITWRARCRRYLCRSIGIFPQCRRRCTRRCRRRCTRRCWVWSWIGRWTRRRILWRKPRHENRVWHRGSAVFTESKHFLYSKLHLQERGRTIISRYFLCPTEFHEMIKHSSGVRILGLQSGSKRNSTSEMINHSSSLLIG